MCVLVGVCVGGVLQLYYWCSCAKGGSPIPVWVKVWQKGVQRFLRGAASALTRQTRARGWMRLRQQHLYRQEAWEREREERREEGGLLQLPRPDYPQRAQKYFPALFNTFLFFCTGARMSVLFQRLGEKPSCWGTDPTPSLTHIYASTFVRTFPVIMCSSNLKWTQPNSNLYRTLSWIHV